MKVTAKKHLGQHFLIDFSIAKRIADSLTHHRAYEKALEIGPGTASMTQFLLKDERFQTDVVEIDRESIAFLKLKYPELEGRIFTEDFLKMDLEGLFGKNIAIVGNFPYNISTQIMFKVYDNRDIVPEVVGMFQKEVAERICAGPGSKTYGILSVLLQAYYTCEYLFTVSEDVFDPPPRVKSGVLRMTRNDVVALDCDEKLFKTVVKTAFNLRRKQLRNSLKSLLPEGCDHALLTQRPEQLSVAEFIVLTKIIDEG